MTVEPNRYRPRPPLWIREFVARRSTVVTIGRGAGDCGAGELGAAGRWPVGGGDAAVHRAGAERSCGRCERSAAKLEGIAAVVMEVITVATVNKIGGEEDGPGSCTGGGDGDCGERETWSRIPLNKKGESNSGKAFFESRYTNRPRPYPGRGMNFSKKILFATSLPQIPRKVNLQKAVGNRSPGQTFLAVFFATIPAHEAFKVVGHVHFRWITNGFRSPTVQKPSSTKSGST